MSIAILGLPTYLVSQPFVTVLVLAAFLSWLRVSVSREEPDMTCLFWIPRHAFTCHAPIVNLQHHSTSIPVAMIVDLGKLNACTASHHTLIQMKETGFETNCVLCNCSLRFMPSCLNQSVAWAWVLNFSCKVHNWFCHEVWLILQWTKWKHRSAKPSMHWDVVTSILV